MFASNYERTSMSASDGPQRVRGGALPMLSFSSFVSAGSDFASRSVENMRAAALARTATCGAHRAALAFGGRRRCAMAAFVRSAGRSERRGGGVRDGAVVRESRRTCGTASRTGNARSNAIFGRRAAVPSASSALDLVVAPRKKPNPAAAGRSQNPGGFALSRRQGRPRGCAQRPPRRWTSRNGAPTRL